MRHLRLAFILLTGVLLVAACGALQEAGEPGADAEVSAILTPIPSEGMPSDPDLLDGEYWMDHAADEFGKVWSCWRNDAAVTADGTFIAAVPTPPAPDVEWRLVVVEVGETVYVFESPKTGDTLDWGDGEPTGAVVCKGDYLFEVTIEKVDGGDEPIADVTFNLTGPDGYDESCTTDADGECAFSWLLAGSYTLSEAYMAGTTLGTVMLNGVELASGLPATVEFALDPGWGNTAVHTFAFVIENLRDDGGEWCSPGFWRNSPIAAGEAAAAGGFSLDDLYLDFFDELEGVNERQRERLGLPESPTLMQVLQFPQVYGGDAFNDVGDLLSEAHPDVAFDGERVEDSCPLPADASRKE